MDEKHIPVCKGGGIYHSHKVQYTKETQQLVKRLLTESKLSIIQKTVLDNMVKNGDPLPKATNAFEKLTIPNNIKTKPKSSTRRTINSIIQSGAYERERYTPTNNWVNHDIEKLRLQNVMAYGKDVKRPDNYVGKKSRHITISVPQTEEITKDEMFENLLFEVEEREEFLEDMERLGEDKKYKDIIENEVASKMRQMEMLDKERFKHEQGCVARFRNKLKRNQLNGVL